MIDCFKLISKLTFVNLKQELILKQNFCFYNLIFLLNSKTKYYKNHYKNL